MDEGVSQDEELRFRNVVPDSMKSFELKDIIFDVKFGLHKGQ